MRRIHDSLLLLFVFVASTSCGLYAPTETTVTLPKIETLVSAMSSSSKDQKINSLTSSSNDIIVSVHGLSSTGYYFSRNATKTFDQATIVLPNGYWKFYGVVYVRNTSDLGELTLLTNCFYGEASLNGIDTLVNLSLAKSECLRLTNYINSDTNDAAHRIPPIILNNDIELDADRNRDKSLKINLIDIGPQVATDAASTITKRISLPVLTLDGGGTEYTLSTCADLNETNKVYLPYFINAVKVGDQQPVVPFWVEYVGYLDQNCSSQWVAQSDEKIVLKMGGSIPSYQESILYIGQDHPDSDFANTHDWYKWSPIKAEIGQRCYSASNCASGRCESDVCK